MVCKIIFCSEFLDIPDKASRKRRRRTQVIAKRYAFHANATTFLVCKSTEIREELNPVREIEN